MFQTLFMLPLAVVIETAVFLVLYLLTPLASRSAALLVGLLMLMGLYGYSVLHWPGVDVLAMYTAVLLVTAYLLAIIAGAREKRRRQGEADGRWFHWAPMALVGFFLVLFAADSLFVFVSRDGLPDPLARWWLPDADNRAGLQSSFPGVIRRDFQKKEALYNAYQEQVRLQQQRGWQIRKGWLGRPVVGRRAVFQVTLADRAGNPISGARVSGLFQRPADSRLDQAFQMRETDIGSYQAGLALPEPGQWDLALFIQRGDQRHELHASTSVDSVPGHVQ